MPDNQLMKFLTLLIMLVSLATALVDLKTASLPPQSQTAASGLQRQ